MKVKIARSNRKNIEYLNLHKGSEGRFADDEHITFVLVKFRFVVFRPFIDEVLTGRIRSCNHEGVQGTVRAVIKLIYSKAKAMLCCTR